MLCETSLALGEAYQYDSQPQIQALKTLFGADGSSQDSLRVSEALTTANFPLLFGTVLSRRLMDQYALVMGSWRDYTFADTTPDFRVVDRFRTTRPGTLLQRGEMGESEVTPITETVIQYGVSEFARTFEVSWRVLVNDDLGALNRVIGEMVDAAKTFEDSFVSALYDNATSQAAMIALGAQYAGTARISEAALETGVNAMRTRTDSDGNRIAPSGLYLVVPPESEIAVLRILESEKTPASDFNAPNVVRRYIQGYRIDPYIQTAPGAVPWYLFAAPSSQFNTVTVARLDSYGDGPQLYLRASDRLPLSPTGTVGAAQAWGGSWMSKAIEIEVEDIIGGWDDSTYVGITNPLGLYYSDGTVA